MRAILITLVVSLVALIPTAAAAPPGSRDTTGPRDTSVVGLAQIDTVDPASTFEFRVHAHGDGLTGSGVIWVAHFNDSAIGWAVVRVDCVRRTGSIVFVTGVVSDAQDFLVGPGEAISLSVRDGAPDEIAFGVGEQVTHCGGPRPGQEVTRGDFTIAR